MINAHIFKSLLVAASDGEVVRETTNQLVSSHEQIILALIAIVATSIAALVYTIKNNTLGKSIEKEATSANQNADATNRAVNNVGPGEHRLWDKIDNIEKSVAHLNADQERFDAHGWETLPADINTAVGLTTTIRNLQNNHAQMIQKLDIVLAELRDHVRWEMEAKYPK